MGVFGVIIGIVFPEVALEALATDEVMVGGIDTLVALTTDGVVVGMVRPEDPETFPEVPICCRSGVDSTDDWADVISSSII